MLVAICALKNGIRIPDKKAADHCYAKKECEWLKLVFKRGGRMSNGQSGRPVSFNGGSAKDVEDFFCEEGLGQIRNFSGGKKSPRFSRSGR
jgi:hypothetical protein